MEAELVPGELRITQLEREAIEKSGDAAKGPSRHFDLYRSLVAALARLLRHDGQYRDVSGPILGRTR